MCSYAHDIATLHRKGSSSVQEKALIMELRLDCLYLYIDQVHGGKLTEPRRKGRMMVHLPPYIFRKRTKRQSNERLNK